ncbi:hypothetical protein Patl1_36110 [Pistacia atlantica]|nr:hypothetical protein Patl1_36110 [Pistacia atlantica]
MADLSVKLAKKKKRKLTSQQEEIRPTKAHRINLPENEPAVVEVEPDQNLEEERPWRNLKLILSIQNKDIDIQKKVELVFCFVNSRVKGGESDENEENETVKTSRLIVFLSDWVQSLLISTEKKGKVDGGKNQSGVIETCLDIRCWVIFKFCLEESLKWHVSLSIARNLLRAIGCIARNALSLVNENSSGFKESFSVGGGYELYSVVLDCLSLVFSWEDAFVLQFSCLVLEPFAKFLRTHPTRKNGFRDFVDKLLESLLHLLGMLKFQSDANISDQTRNLLTLVEEVLSNGLFHPTHIDGFLGLRATEKYLASHERKSGDSKTAVKSYHRHIFDKLESIMTAKEGISVEWHRTTVSPAC